jgi:hypothetical protein
MSKENKLSLEALQNIDLEKVHIKDRLKIQKLIKELKERKFNYPILDFKTQKHQKEVLEAVGLAKQRS